MKKVEHDLPRFRVVAYWRTRCAAAVIASGGGTPAEARVNRGFLRYLRVPALPGDPRDYWTITPIFGAGSYLYSAGPKFLSTAVFQSPSATIFVSAALIFFSSSASPFLTPMP